MKRLRFSFLVLLFIIGVFLNIERLDVGNAEDVVNLQSFVYFLAAAAVLSVIALPERFRPPGVLLTGFWLVVYLVLKLTVFDQQPLIGGVYTYLTVTELAMLSLMSLAGSRVASDLYDVEDTVANVTLEDVSERVRKLEQAEDEISKEFARSRRYDSPISVMVLKVESEDVEFNIQRTAEEILQGMMKRYATNKMVRLLDRELRRTDLVLERTKDNQVILVLPETSAGGTDVLADRIRSAVKEQLGIAVTAGFASFPDQALTFEDLLKQAEHDTDKPQVEGKAEEVDQLSKAARVDS